MKLKTNKNVILINFKKLLTLAFNEYEKENENPNLDLHLSELKEGIKKCFSIETLIEILAQNRDFRSKLIQLYKSQGLLHRLYVGKGYYKNFAECLKNFNMFVNIIHDPYNLKNVYWTSNHSVSLQQNKNRKEKLN